MDGPTNSKREFGHIYRRRTRDKMTGEVREHPFWWVRYRINGKLHRESTESADRRKAEKMLAERQIEAERGLFVEPVAKRTTFADLASDFLKHYETNRFRSMRRAKTSVENLRRFFGDCRALTITPARVREYVAERQHQGAANATVQNELAALGKMLSLAVEDGLLARKPKLPRLRVDNARQGFFEESDFRALLAELPDYLRPAIEFAYLTGWRVPSEVLPLRWAQVDFKAKVVRLEPGTTKNGEGRSFPFATYPALEALLVTQRERTTALERTLERIIPSVFHQNGAAIGRFDKSWKSAIWRAAHNKRGPMSELVRPQLLGRIPHDLRRTAVRNLERAGVPRSVAMKLTGHKTEAVYRRYAIVAEADLRDGVEKLAALHGGAHGGAHAVGGDR